MKKTRVAALAAFLCIVSRGDAQTPGPAYPLPGDTGAALVAGRQERPAIARGGDGYLVAWADNRSSLLDIGIDGATTSGPLLGPELGSKLDIYAARLDANGALIDVSPIIISQAQHNQTRVKVAWNGANWLVVWMTERESDPNLKDVVAVRVSPGGVVLDASPILIDAGSSLDEHNPWSVTTDGTNWTVIWCDLSPTAGGIFTIDGARISPAGVNLDPGGKRLHAPSVNTGATDADLAWAGDEYLLTFLEMVSGGWAVHARRLNPALEPVGPAFTLNLYSPSAPVKPAVASNGTDFLVTWFENRYPEYTQLFAARVAHDGTVLDPAGLELTELTPNLTQFEPDVTWDGTAYVVAHNHRDDIYTTRVTDSGTVSGSTIVRTTPRYQVEAAIAPGFGGGAVVAWNDDHGVRRSDIVSARVSANGDVSPVVPVSLGAPRQSHPRMATNGTEFLVVFRSVVSGEMRIMAQRLDASGAPLDAEPAVVAAGSDLRTPSAAWNGIDYYIVWENSAEGRGQVYGRRMHADGTLAGGPVSLMPGNMPDVAALGTTFLVIDAWERVPHDRFTQVLRVAGDGAPIGTPVRTGGGFDLWPRVIAAGSRWLAVWEQDVTHDDPHSRIVGAFIAGDGTASPRFDISDFRYRDTPHLAHAGNTTLVTWADRDIFGRRIQDDGTLLDTAAGIVISAAPQDQFTPAVTWDGAQWIVDYLDQRNEAYPKQPRGDIYATRVDANGAVIDPQGFAVANSPLPEDTPTILAASGAVVFAYAALHDEAPYKNMRVTIRSTGTPACEYFVSPATVDVPAGGGSVSITLTTAGTCPWTVATKDGWLTITSPLQGQGSATISVTVPANGGSARTATITIAEQPVAIRQAALVLPDAPQSVAAIATSTTEVAVSWSGVANAASYEIARSANGSPFTVIASRTTPSLVDSGLTPSTSYLYKVRAVNADGASAFSGLDAATTIVFDAQSMVRAAHIEQLRTAVNALRRSAALPAATFSDAAVAGVAVRALHVEELREAVAEARNALGLTGTSSQLAALSSQEKGARVRPAGLTEAVIRAADFEEIRSGVR
jgi:hypothetical protein